jgi:arabinan endo-1,5-alpha-L-arabinosidase
VVELGDLQRVFDPSAGEAEEWYVNDHSFIRDSTGTWHLFGITHAEPMLPADEKHLLHATAPALSGPWTKHAYALSADSDAGETVLWAPHVIHHDGTYWMFVCGGGTDKRSFRIQLATSNDCWTWTRHPKNPMVLDGFEARDPMVLPVGDRWVMYYTATDSPAGGHHVVAAVESADLVHWSNRRIVYRDAMVGTFGGPTESPFVVERDGRWYLFIGPDWERTAAHLAKHGSFGWAGYRGTRVLESDDPFHFDLDGMVGFLDTHATEVVIDEAGRMWASHCGWNQGGVHLAPLRWVDG